MKNSGIGHIIAYIIVAVLAIFLTKWIFEAVMASNWPDWLKYMILRR